MRLDHIYRNAGLNLNVLYLVQCLENTNFQEPIKRSLTTKYLFAVTTQSKIIGFGFEKDKLFTDTSFVVEESNTIEFYSFSYSR
jgi:hypothetical protein